MLNIVVQNITAHLNTTDMYTTYDNMKAIERYYNQISDAEAISALRNVISHSYYETHLPDPCLDALSKEDIKAIKLDLAQKKMGISSMHSVFRTDSTRFNTIISHLNTYKQKTVPRS